MKAVIANVPGGPEVLEICEVERRHPQHDEVELKVLAFGLNKTEAYNRKGKHGAFSGQFALGIEAVGVVVNDPSGKYSPGQRVVTAMGDMMFSRHGSYAEYICVKRDNTIAVDSPLDDEQLATLPEACLTAWGILEHSLSLKIGQSLLVRGGTTTIGMAAITLAKHMGATVIATTRKPARVEKLLGIGADHVLIDDQELATQVRQICPIGVDGAIELVGSATLKDTLKATRKWGEVAFVGFVGGSPVMESFHMMNDMPNTVKLSFFGSGILGSDDLPLENAPINAIANAIYTGSMSSIHSKTFSFDDIREAHRLLESDQAFGKIVVQMP